LNIHDVSAGNIPQSFRHSLYSAIYSTSQMYMFLVNRYFMEDLMMFGLRILGRICTKKETQQNANLKS